MRAWLTLAGLALVVAALGAWLHQRPAEPTRESHALSQLKAHEVRRIRIERGAESGAPASVARLERVGDRWRLTEPLSARAEPLQVDRLLAILDAQSVARFPAADLVRYGLAPPSAILTLNEESFGLGGVNATTREQYVLAGQHVYAIPLALRTAVPRDIDTLISRALFDSDEEPVRLELPDFTAALEAGTWTFSPVDEQPGPDERNGWVGAWRQASAVQATRHDPAQQPSEKINVHLMDGRTITLGIVQREPELVLLRADEGIRYHFLANAGKRLLSPPGSAQSKSEAASK